MKSRKSFLLRMSPALYEAIEALAQQELRSVNGQIEYLLQEALRKRGRTVDPASALDQPQQANGERAAES
jgi:hypothetical protein